MIFLQYDQLSFLVIFLWFCLNTNMVTHSITNTLLRLTIDLYFTPIPALQVEQITVKTITFSHTVNLTK